MTIFIDGFEQFKNAQPLIEKLTRAGYAPGFNGAVAMANGRRANTQAFQTTDGVVRRTWPWTGRYFSTGAAIMMQNRGNLMTLTLGSEKVVAWIDIAQGLPMLNTVAGGSMPWTKTWYYIELLVDRTLSRASLWLNGRLEVDGLAISPSAAAAEEITVSWGTQHPGIPMGNIPLNGGIVLYDDVYIRDGARLGPLAVTTRFPTSSGPVAWEPSPDAPNNHEAVSLIPPKELDVNVSAATPGATDYYQSTATLPNGNTIVVTGLCVLARKAPALDARLGLFIQGNGVAPRAGAIDLEATWKTRYLTFDQQLTDTQPGIEGASFGIKVD